VSDMYIHLAILFVFTIAVCIVYKQMNYPALFAILDVLLVILCFVCFFDYDQPFYPALTLAALFTGVFLAYKLIIIEREGR